MSNPNDAPEQRRPGHVGLPLPSVQIRPAVMENDRNVKIPPNSSANNKVSIDQGLLQVKGPTVFCEYLNQAEATKEVFDDEGHFHTGDVSEYIVDILKAGG